MWGCPFITCPCLFFLLPFFFSPREENKKASTGQLLTRKHLPFPYPDQKHLQKHTARHSAQSPSPQRDSPRLEGRSSTSHPKRPCQAACLFVFRFCLDTSLADSLVGEICSPARADSGAEHCSDAGESESGRLESAATGNSAPKPQSHSCVSLPSLAVTPHLSPSPSLLEDLAQTAGQKIQPGPEPISAGISASTGPLSGEARKCSARQTPTEMFGACSQRQGATDRSGAPVNLMSKLTRGTSSLRGSTTDTRQGEGGRST